MKKEFFILTMCIALVFGFTACSSDDDNDGASDVVKATAIELSKPSLSVEVGKTANLAVKVTPSDATGTVVWSSSDEKIAKVQNGIVTGVKAGDATITASIDNLKATCEVTVTEPDIIDTDKLLTGSDYYLFALDDTSKGKIPASKIKGDYRINGNYGEEGTTSTLEVWGNTFGGGTPSGPNSFGLVEGWISLLSETGDGWGLGCGGIRQTGGVTVDLRGVTKDHVLVITYQANSSVASDFVKFSVYSTNATGAEWPKEEIMGSTVFSANTKNEWKLLEIPMSTLFNAGVDWSTPFVDGVTKDAEGGLKAFYTLGLLITSIGNQLDVDAAFIYKPAN